MAKKIYEEENIRAIANKIREKTGGDSTYKTSEMPDGIERVYNEGKSQGTGGYDEGYKAGQKSEYDRFWDEFQVNGTRKNYKYAFAGTNFNVETLNPKYVPIVLTGTNATSMFLNNTSGYPNYRDYTEICKKIDFSQITDASSLFQNICGRNITVDLSNCEKASNAFNCNSGGSVDNVTLKVTEKLTDASMFFYYNSDLTTLTFTDDSVIAFAMNLSRCSKLTHDSLMSIINALKNFATKKTLRYADGSYGSYDISGCDTDPKGFGWNVTKATLSGTTLICECYYDEWTEATFSVYGIDITEEDVANIKTICADVVDFNNETYEFVIDVVITTEEVTVSKTLTIGTTNLAKLTADERQIAKDKGWTLA